MGMSQGVTPLGSGSGTEGSLVITPAMTASATPVICTITNTRKTANLVLTKAWSTSPVNGNGVNLVIGGSINVADAGINTNNGAAGDDDAADVGVFVGEILSLTETALAGTDLANYSATLTCSYLDNQGATVTITGPPSTRAGSVTIPAGRGRQDGDLSVRQRSQVDDRHARQGVGERSHRRHGCVDDRRLVWRTAGSASHWGG